MCVCGGGGGMGEFDAEKWWRTGVDTVVRENLTISDFEIWFMRPRFAIPCMSQSGSSLPPL